MEEYPREVQGQPLLLAALVGATSLHPSLTESLHEAAVNASGQRRFKYLSSTYDMRILPAKRCARDGSSYRMEGVLKRKWLEKMCGSVPAVLVLCIDWSEDLSQPQQEESQALHYLQHARRQAKERDLRLVVFLVLHTGIADPEAASSPFQSEALVVANGREDVTAKAPALERRIYQDAMAFYQDEEKRVRRPWNPKIPNPSVQAAMQVRTNFKAAFLNEFRKDARAALTAYIKAYEQLLKSSDVIDAVERMDLCNHITVRMYQRYFGSHDVGAAVHHCRIHVASLRRSCPDGEHAWQKWHWLSLNHQIFGDLLDIIIQKAPLLIDTGDIWQFPGFHFQAAAVYARRLREWAVRFLEPGHLRPSDAGGELIPSPFVGQAGKLERPSEVSMPNQEVALRLALAQAQKYSEHAERSLKLLIRAQAAGKERGFTAWVTSSQIRVAEAYLCDPGSSHQEAARDLFERLRDKTLPSSASWPPFKRFFLERSLLCGCAQLGLPPPALCSSTRAAPGSLDDLEPTPTDKLRSSFAKDAFEYLMMKTVPARNDPRQGEELLELVRKAADPLPAGSVEIQLHSGVLSQGLLDFTLTFDTSLLPVDLELGTCIAQTDDDDNISVDLEMTTWRAEQPLELKGLPANVNSVRFTWSSSPAIIFVGASNRRQTAGFNFRLPGAEEVGFPESFSRSLPRGRLGAQWSEMKAVKSDLFFPVDPAKALVSECFILYVTLSPPNGHSVSSPLFLSARFHIVDEDAELAPSTPPAPFSPLESSCLPSVSLISEPWEMMPLGSKILVADVANALIPKAGILAFKPGELKTPGANEAFAWPIAVQCGRPCKMALRIVFELDGAQISCPSCYINFQHAIKLQIAEERIATALALRRPVSFSLKCLSTPVETKSVEVCLGDSEMAKCLGTPGFMASGSQHSFLWTPGPSEKPRLQVQFQRGKGTEEFFLWCEEGRRKSLPQALPNAIVEWPLESIPQSPTSPQVELEVCSTGTVGASVLVRVQVKNMSFSTEEEIRVRILQGEGEVSDRYLLSGPVSYQVAAPLGSDPNQAIQSFALIPLKAGWLSLPRVQVSWAGQDATSSPTSLFVSPAAKPALWRTAA